MSAEGRAPGRRQAGSQTFGGSPDISIGRGAASLRPAANPALGTGLMVLAATCFATMDNSVRHIGAFVPLLVVLFWRYAFQAGAMAIWLLLAPGAGFRAARPRFQILRGLMLLAMSGLSFVALQHMPVAEFTAINMLSPLMITLLSAWMLHERVSRLRWALVIGGFIGALIVIRPGSGLFGWVVALPLLVAILNAGFQLLTSRLAGSESPYTTHFYTGLTGVVVLAPLLWLSSADTPAMPLDLPLRHWLVMLAIGALGTVGHLLLILSLGLASTATLMPFIYTQIAITAGVSWLFFGQLPDGWGWLGIGVIAACGAASAWLNVRDAQRPASVVAADTLAD